MYISYYTSSFVLYMLFRLLFVRYFLRFWNGYVTKIIQIII